MCVCYIYILNIRHVPDIFDFTLVIQIRLHIYFLFANNIRTYTQIRLIVAHA